MRDKYERFGFLEGIFGVPGSGVNAVMISQIKELLKHEDVRIVVVDLVGSGRSSAKYYNVKHSCVDVTCPEFFNNGSFLKSVSVPLCFLNIATDGCNVCCSDVYSVLQLVTKWNAGNGFRTVIYLDYCEIPDKLSAVKLSTFLDYISRDNAEVTLVGELLAVPVIKYVRPSLDYCVFLHQSEPCFDVLKKVFHISKWKLKELQYAEPGTGLVWYRNKRKTIIEEFALDLE